MNRSATIAIRVMALAMSLLAIMPRADAQGIRQVPPATLAAILSQPLLTPPSGSSKGDVTVVEYFDYNCPICRQIEPQLRKLLANESRVRLIHKDWPVFGDASAYAAYCSFAAARQGRYEVAHDALIGSKQDLDSKEDVRKVMREAGFDLQKIDADISIHEQEYARMLERNRQETIALRLRGTPGLIIGDQLVPGGLQYSQLVTLVAQARNHR
jgi:protein-disulfide isomerase